MTMGPAPMIMIDWMSVLFGIGSPARRANWLRYRDWRPGRKGRAGLRPPRVRTRLRRDPSAAGPGGRRCLRREYLARDEAPGGPIRPLAGVPEPRPDKDSRG